MTRVWLPAETLTALDEPSQIFSLAERWFLPFNAECEFRIVMRAEDLQTAGLAEIEVKWKQGGSRVAWPDAACCVAWQTLPVAQYNWLPIAPLSVLISRFGWNASPKLIHMDPVSTGKN
ncbi:hypothetical protein [Ralstonia pseudosolanacearum]|uniref:hypothetical protein n=1 Tax=Ralstonia pseudosolanacearum TaxID=1310165 RepID=UPI00399D68DA